MKKVLTIAGSDCSGGAGIQADLKTMLAHGVYGMSAITALTAQNTTGVFAVQESSPDFLTAQLKAIFEDIPPDAVKIGMVSSVPLIQAIAQGLKDYKASNIVVDPVMVATSGSSLLQNDAVTALRTLLFPLAQVITPNLQEAEVLVGFPIETQADMERAAQLLAEECPGAILIKGGHLTGGADDLLWVEGTAHWFRGQRIDSVNTHGTGCTLSSALACQLALGLDLVSAFGKAKEYVTGALEDGMDLGKGNGPLNHGFRI